MEPESSSPVTLPTIVPEHRVVTMDKGSIQRFMSQVRENALEVINLKRQWKEYEEAYASMEKTVRKHVIEVKKKEEESDMKQSLEAHVMMLALEMQTQEVVTQLKEEVEAREKELSLSITEKCNELKKREEELEVKRKSVEVSENSFEEVMREFEVRKSEVRLDDENIKRKASEMEKQEAEGREIEVKRKSLEVKEKQLEERKELLEKIELDKESKRRKRSRDEDSLIHTGKRHRPIRKHNHDGKDKETDCGLYGKTSSDPASAKGREIYEVDDGGDEDPEPYCCPDADINSFNTTMSSFSVGQVWALYDPLDHMPRYYAKIRKILKPQLRVGVRWLESTNKKPVPISCGEFKYGEKNTSSHLMFSHEIHHIRTGKKSITINPRKGETWALFRDWNRDKKHPYGYDFVQVVSDLDSDYGIGVAYLGRVEGFTSVYKLAEQNGVLQIMIKADEMLRFSHRVPSFVLSGDEKEGVPAGSFELDPAAIPRDYLEASKVKQEESVVQV